MPVAESVSARIGESIEIRVEPGTSAETLRQSAKNAEQALSKACGNAGVSNPEEAESAWLALQDAKRTVADRERVVKEHLRDVTRQEFKVLVQSTRAKVLAYPEQRKSTLTFPRALRMPRSCLMQRKRLRARRRRPIKLRKRYWRRSASTARKAARGLRGQGSVA